MSTLSYPFYCFPFALTPNFCPSPWWPPSTVTAAIRRYNPALDNPVENPFPLFYPASNMMGGAVLCWPLLCRRRRQSYQIHPFRSAKWETIDGFPPNLPDFVLLHLFCRRPHRPVSLLPSSSTDNTIVSHQLPFSPPPPPLPLPPTEYASPSVQAGMQNHMRRPSATERGRYDNDGLPRCFLPLTAPPGTHLSLRWTFEVEEEEGWMRRDQP